MHRVCLFIVVAVVAAAMAAPAIAVAQAPAVEQYTLQIPAAGGDKPLPGKEPSARRDLLPPDARSQLSGPEDDLLARIATAPGFGAPQTDDSDTKSGGDQGEAAQSAGGLGLASTERGIPAILADALGSGSGLVLLIALATIAALALLAQRRDQSKRRTG
jgi:hypothetical protein